MMKSVALKAANILAETGVFRFFCPQSVPVFMIHRMTTEDSNAVGRLSVNTLRRHLSYLRDNGFHVLSMGELWRFISEGQAVPPKSVAFTIDDGFSDHSDLAAKVFDEFGFVLNFFVITGFLDRKLWPWDDQLAFGLAHAKRRKAKLRLPSGDLYCIDLRVKTRGQQVRALRNCLKQECQSDVYPWLKSELFSELGVPFPEDIPADYAPMSWEDARALVRQGHGVYPHTYSHRILASLEPEEQLFEIRESFSRVSDEIGGPVRVFAYPTGRKSDYDSTAIDCLKRTEADMSFTTTPGYVKEGVNPYEIPRFSLPESHDQFKQIVNRFEAFKERIRAVRP
ncbi:polysaccharide deacetylase family protein [Marinobacter salinisoli]|uniref:Polysaccharide deacetylase family protein n=1 Tax=Marinobacter salinisoli TaxID=2769486 RepID=A0ABX7MNA3_9GAMM|nr:polysaccharide deacetylase family protein [Marinobacter salinisoli]QSP93669.1 polysaccharide deacetylase family protein [Marinobacter salinisoli]